CRGWGRLRHFANPEPGELQMALDCVDHVRRWGGVVEHPEASLLWKLIGATPGETDKHGGWLLPIYQSWWGHLAEKSTMLYIVGIDPADIPEMPMTLLEPTHVITQGLRMGDADWRPRVTDAE